MDERERVVAAAGDLWAALVDVPPETPVMLWVDVGHQMTVPDGVESVGCRVVARYASNSFSLRPVVETHN